MSHRETLQNDLCAKCDTALDYQYDEQAQDEADKAYKALRAYDERMSRKKAQERVVRELNAEQGRSFTRRTRDEQVQHWVFIAVCGMGLLAIAFRYVKPYLPL